MTEQSPQPEMIPLRQWAEEQGVTYQAVLRRCQVHGIPITHGRVNRDEANAIWARLGNPIAQNKRSGRPPGGINHEVHPRQPILAFKAPEGGGRSLGEIEIDRAAVKLAKERLALATAAGKVYPAAAVDQHVTGMITAARETLYHLPGELQDRLAACMDPIECGRILERAIDGALRKLAGFNAGGR